MSGFFGGTGFATLLASQGRQLAVDTNVRTLAGSINIPAGSFSLSSVIQINSHFFGGPGLTNKNLRIEYEVVFSDASTQTIFNTNYLTLIALNNYDIVIESALYGQVDNLDGTLDFDGWLRGTISAGQAATTALNASQGASTSGKANINSITFENLFGNVINAYATWSAADAQTSLQSNFQSASLSLR